MKNGTPRRPLIEWFDCHQHCKFSDIKISGGGYRVPFQRNRAEWFSLVIRRAMRRLIGGSCRDGNEPSPRFFLGLLKCTHILLLGDLYLFSSSQLYDVGVAFVHWPARVVASPLWFATNHRGLSLEQIAKRRRTVRDCSEPQHGAIFGEVP